MPYPIIYAFSCAQAWSWDLNFKGATLRAVQDIMIKFYTDVDLPVASWTDNAGAFRNIISAAIEATLGVRARTIPPGRPQSNGLVECRNKIFDASCGGQRARLAAATIAYNQKNTAVGLPPETIWRLLRPQESRWRNMHLKNAMEEPSALTEEEWVAYLDAKQYDKESLEEKAKSLHQLIQPLRNAISSKKLRQRMKSQLKWIRKRPNKTAMPLVAGDMVLSRNIQYVAKSGPRKFETTQEGVETFEVLQCRQGFAEVKNLRTGQVSWKHEANLKLWPRSMPPDDAYFPTPLKGPGAPCKRPAPAFEVIAAEGDGACLFRCFSMALQARAGVPAKAIVDSTESAMKLREEILRHMELSLQRMDGDSMALLQEQIRLEMWDDPGWMEGPGKAAWNWKNYFQYMRHPRAYGTAAHIGAFSESKGIAVVIYENGHKIWTTNDSNNPIVLQKTGLHYNLLLLRRLRRKTRL